MANDSDTKKTETDTKEVVKDPAAKGKEEGTVKWFDPQKNFGFIGREGKDDVFVHANALEGITITEGDQVKFNVEQGEKGPSAVNVEKV